MKTSIRGKLRSRLACACILGIAGTLTANAQFGQGAPYTPEPDAEDLKSVIFNWMWHMGMLKGVDERDMVASYEYQGEGAIEVDGEACTLTRYRQSTNFQTFSQRIDYDCTLPDGAAVSNIEVVSGFYAWDEDVRGAQIGEMEGTVTPRANTVDERLIRIWASSQGAAKAALAGTTETYWLGANPGTLFDDGPMTVRNTSVRWEDGRPVLTFPLPGLPGATATAWLDDRFMTERVVVEYGSDTTEFRYSDYEDWNNPLHKIEVFHPGRIVERRNGRIVRDLTTVETETGNVYVVAPVPERIRAAINPDRRLPEGVFAKNEPEVDFDAPTPRIAGKPDMTGVWSHNDWIGSYGSRRCGPTQSADCTPMVNQTEGFALYSPSRFGQLNRPLYKPEFWDEVIELDMWTNRYDPVMTCQPLGLPRQGPPDRIYQTERDMTILYSQYADAGGGLAEFRVVPIDGREHDDDAIYQYTYYGDTVGHWEGDTLVLDSVGFVDTTWFGRGGFFHSDRMRIVERLTRRGEAILYDITVEDPVVLVEPYVFPTRTLRLNASPNAGLISERGNCEVFEDEAIATQLRH